VFKPAKKINLSVELMTDAFSQILAIAITINIYKIMAHWKHNSYFKNPANKFLLGLTHFNCLLYTCSNRAYGFMKGGSLFHQL